MGHRVIVVIERQTEDKNAPGNISYNPRGSIECYTQEEVDEWLEIIRLMNLKSECKSLMAFYHLLQKELSESLRGSKRQDT
jgi:hypothetical protein